MPLLATAGPIGTLADAELIDGLRGSFLIKAAGGHLFDKGSGAANS